MQHTATITVIGRDKTGVVARITSFLFVQKANIEALEEQVTRGQFSMTVQTSWKDCQLNATAVRGGLEALARELDMEIKIRFEEHEIDFVVLARFMKILSPNFVWRYKNKIINIHPSLLPSFPGPQAYRQAYEQGVKIIGVSAHFVTMNLDEGPIIAQDCFVVRPSMSLKDIVARGQKLEAATLLKAVKLYLDKRLDVHWGIVKEV